MTSDITTTTTPTLTLEQCDEAATQGILLLSEAVLNYAKHGLTSKAIGERVRGLGQNIGDRTVRRWISGFKADKLLPEGEKTQAAEKQQRYRDRVTNGQNGQTLPTPTPEPEIIEAEVHTITPEPSWEEVMDMGAKTSEHINTTVSTLNGLLDFIAMGDTLSDEAHLTLSILHKRLTDVSKIINRPLTLDFGE